MPKGHWCKTAGSLSSSGTSRRAPPAEQSVTPPLARAACEAQRPPRAQRRPPPQAHCGRSAGPRQGPGAGRGKHFAGGPHKRHYSRPAARRSPVGMPSSLEPLPKPFTTSPRQKYGRCLMTAGGRQRPLVGHATPRAALTTTLLQTLLRRGEALYGAFQFSIATTL